MSSIMHDVKQLVNHLPDDASIEDVQYHLYVLEKVRKGREDIRQGRHYTTEEAREHLSRCPSLPYGNFRILLRKC